MLNKLQQKARRSKSLLIAFTIYKNWRMRSRFNRGQIQTGHGSSHAAKTLSSSLAYINEQFNDYMKYGSVAAADLEGKRILEIGFGDNLGVALKFLAAGAKQVVGIDKFYSARDEKYERDVYRALRDTLNDEERKRFDAAVNLNNGIALNEASLKRIYGVDLEQGIDELSDLQQPFDLVISRAVIEEIYQPDKLFEALDRVLASGGMTLHKIDLSDYGMFRENGMHPLTFLTIPDFVYRLMGSDSGIPNRKRIGYYREQLKKLGYRSKFFITSILGVGTLEPHKESVVADVDYSRLTLDLITQIRPALDEQFRHFSDEELMIEGVFVVAKKA